MYNAMSVANFIIDTCTKEKDPVSNLRLQKLLYFLWVGYYRETNKSLFADNMYAWQFGPVVPEVYYEYCSYGGRPINLYCEIEIQSPDEKIIKKILDKYKSIPVNQLVEWTHKVGTAWYIVFDEGRGNKKVIPFSLIKEKDIGEEYVS